jgi:hypothetical protein
MVRLVNYIITQISCEVEFGGSSLFDKLRLRRVWRDEVGVGRCSEPLRGIQEHPGFHAGSGVSTFSESKRMMLEEEDLFAFVFFALYQGTTSVVPPIVQK